MVNPRPGQSLNRSGVPSGLLDISGQRLDLNIVKKQALHLSLDVDLYEGHHFGFVQAI